MPKLKPDQVYGEFSKVAQTGNVEALTEMMIENYEDTECMKEMERFCDDFVKGATEKGPEGKERGELAKKWLEQIIVTDVSSRIDAGRKMEETEKKIQAGEVPDTELITGNKKKVKAIAHDMIHQSDLGVRYMATNDAKLKLADKLRKYNVYNLKEINYVVKSEEKVNEIIKKVAKEKGLTEKEAFKYTKKAEGFDLEANEKYGFKVKNNYVEGEYPFDKVPKIVEDIKNASPEQLEKMVKDNQDEMQQFLKYEKEALQTKNEASALLEELDTIKKDGHINSIEYDEMRRGLENLSNMGNGMIVRKGDMHITTWDFSPKNSNYVLDELKNASEKYEADHKSFFKGRSQFGSDRQAFAIRLKEFAIREKQRLEQNKPHVAGPVYSGIKKRNEVVEMVVLEQKRRGLVPKDFKIEPVKTAFAVPVHDEYVDSQLGHLSKLDVCILDARKSNRKVHRSSGEFDQSIEALQGLSGAWKKWIEASKGTDKEALRKSTDELQKHIAKADKATEGYLQRKERQGKTKENADANTKERIELMENAKKYIVYGINDLTKYKMKELNMVNPQPARERYQTLIDQSKGSHKLAAQGALSGISILTKLSDTTKGPLAGKDLVRAKTAIAGLVYNEILRSSGVKPKQMNQEQYLAQVKELSQKEEFNKCLPQEINEETINQFIQNENAAKELANGITLEMSKNISKQAEKNNIQIHVEVAKTEPQASAFTLS